MRIGRFNDDRLGLIEGQVVIDISGLVARLPGERWPYPQGDWLMRHFEALLRLLDESRRDSKRWASLPRHDTARVKWLPAIANPGKIIGAPINYSAHIDEANRDPEINHGKTFSRIDQYGLFIKASSALIGVGDKIQPRFADRRTDHEIELVVVIGKTARQVRAEQALDHVAGYCVGLDVTVRGPEFPGFRKSVDTYAVLGPWMVSRDEITDPNTLDLELRVNGVQRQKSNTRLLVFNVQRLIEYASSFYTLYPGDLIYTGTPEGVGPLASGDQIESSIAGIGELNIRVA